MPIRNEGLRSQTYTTNFEKLEGDEYFEDLKRRNGGLMSNRQADRKQIESFKMGIASGAFTDEQIDALLYRNPNARQELSGAIPPERRIMSQFSTPAKPEMPVPFVDEQAQAFGDEAVPGFVAQPQGLVERIDPAVPAMFKEESREQAALAAEAQGLFDTARNIRFGSKLNKGSEAKSKFTDYVDEKGDEYIEVRDPYSGALINRLPKGTNKFNKDAQEISSRVTRSKLSMAMAPLIHVDKHVQKYKETGKIPGVGGAKNLSKSTWFLSEEGKSFQRSANRLAEIDLRLLTGAAAPEFEFRRSQAMQALGLASTAKDFIRAYDELVYPLWSDIAATSIGGFDPRARSRWTSTTPRAQKIIDLAEGRPLTQVGKTIKPKNQPAGKSIKQMSDEELLNAIQN